MVVISKNTGVCFLCNCIFSDKEMVQHLQTCVKKTAAAKTQTEKPVEIFRIKIFAEDLFWLYIDMLATSSLKTLDDFLRIIWLECCNHLSEFKIHGTTCNIETIVKKLFKKGSKFSYEYDFGSTTYLQGTVINCYQGYLGQDIRLLARNDMPTLKCTTCSATPKFICSVCQELCCKKCLKNHECDEEAMSSIVNSPRMGVCGYDGMENDEDLTQFLP